MDFNNRGLSDYSAKLTATIVIFYLYEKNEKTFSPALAPEPYAPPFSLYEKQTFDMRKRVWLEIYVPVSTMENDKKCKVKTNLISLCKNFVDNNRERICNLRARQRESKTY